MPRPRHIGSVATVPVNLPVPSLPGFFLTEYYLTEFTGFFSVAIVTTLPVNLPVPSLPSITVPSLRNLTVATLHIGEQYYRYTEKTHQVTLKGCHNGRTATIGGATAAGEKIASVFMGTHIVSPVRCARNLV